MGKLLEQTEGSISSLTMNVVKSFPQLSVFIHVIRYYLVQDFQPATFIRLEKSFMIIHEGCG